LGGAHRRCAKKSSSSGAGRRFFLIHIPGRYVDEKISSLPATAGRDEIFINSVMFWLGWKLNHRR